MPRPRHENQLLRPAQCRIHTPRMIRTGIAVVLSMQEQHGNPNPPGALHRTDRISFELCLLLCQPERRPNRCVSQNESRPISRDAAQVSKGFSRHNRPHPFILSRGLQRYGSSQRRPDKYDWPGINRVENLRKILLLVIAVRAMFTFRLPLCPAVKRQHIEPSSHESLDRANRAGPIIRDPLKINDRAAAFPRGLASPAFQPHARALEIDVPAMLRRRNFRHPPVRMQQSSRRQFRRASERGHTALRLRQPRAARGSTSSPFRQRCGED